MFTIQHIFCRYPHSGLILSSLLLMISSFCSTPSLMMPSPFFLSWCHVWILKTLPSYAFESNHQEMTIYSIYSSYIVAIIFNCFVPGYLSIAIDHTPVLLIMFPLLLAYFKNMFVTAIVTEFDSHQGVKLVPSMYVHSVSFTHWTRVTLKLKPIDIYIYVYIYTYI